MFLKQERHEINDFKERKKNWLQRKNTKKKFIIFKENSGEKSF